MTDQDPQTYAIIGAAMEVHAELGHGSLEKVYHEALIRELGTRVIPFQRECELPIFYKGERLPCVYRADLICFGNIIVELIPIRSTDAPDLLALFPHYFSEEVVP